MTVPETAHRVQWTAGECVIHRESTVVHNVAVPSSIWAAVVVSAIAVWNGKVTGNIAQTVIDIKAVFGRDLITG